MAQRAAGAGLKVARSQPPTRLRLNSKSDFRTEAGLLQTERIWQSNFFGTTADLRNGNSCGDSGLDRPDIASRASSYFGSCGMFNKATDHPVLKQVVGNCEHRRPYEQS